MDLEPPGRAAAAAMVTVRRGTGTSPTRWPKPQHGKVALELARATLRLSPCGSDRENGPRSPALSPIARARRQTEPHLPPRRRRPLSPIPFSRIPDRGERWSCLRSAAMVTAPVEGRGRRQHDGPKRTTARWPPHQLALLSPPTPAPRTGIPPAASAGDLISAGTI